MEIALPARLQQYVQAQVRAGKYATADELVSDAVRRMQESDPETSAGIVSDAIKMASQAQRDLLSLVQRADEERNVMQQIMGVAGNAVDASRGLARKVPVAREVERAVSGSLEQVSNLTKQGELEARQMRQGLEATAKLLGLLSSTLEKVNGATSALNRNGSSS